MPTDAFAQLIANRANRQSLVTIDTIDPPVSGGEVDSNRPLLSGRAPANSLVTIYVNGSSVGTATATSAGTWTYQLAAQLNGEKSIVVRASPASNTLDVTINDPLQPMIGYDGAAALFDMNNTGGIYWTDNTLYTSASDLLTSLGATVSGVQAAWGDFLDTTAPYEYFTQPAFNSLPTLATGGGYTASVVSGELNVVSAGGTSNPYVSFGVAAYKGRAFRFSGEGRRGTVTTNPPAPVATLANSALGGNLTSGSALGASTASWSINCSGPATGTMYCGLRGTNSGSGTLYCDNWSIQEVQPLQGFLDFARGDNTVSQPAWSAVADAELPAFLSGTQSIFQGDAGSENHRIRLSVNSSGVLQLTVQLNASTASTLSLGTFSPSDRVRVAARLQQGTNGTTSGVSASVNGGPRVSDTAATVTLPGVSHFRIGQSATGSNTFSGTYNQVAILRGAAPHDWCEYESRLDDTSLVVSGDSYVDGSNGVALKTALATATGLKCINIAAGGTTLASQVATYQGKPYLAGLRFVHWDGSDNGYSSITNDIANYQAFVDAQGGTDKFLFIAPVPVPNPGGASSSTPTAQSIRCAARVTAMVTAFGAAHVFDPLAALQALGNGGTDDNNDIAAGLVPRSCLYDASSGQVHLSSTAMTAVADAIHASGKIAAL